MAHMVQKYAQRVLVGKPDVKRPLGRLRNRWENKMFKNLKEILRRAETGFT
jgi:hypothetical protein